MERLVSKMPQLPRPVAFDGEAVILLDQTKLPFQEAYLRVIEPREMFEAIRCLIVRGAPAIGIAAGYGLCAAMRPWAQGERAGFLRQLDETAEYLARARPTAVNLRHALDRVTAAAHRAAGEELSPYQAMVREARSIEAGEENSCRRIGEHFLSLLTEGMSLLTHCNAGALATIRYGTALSPILLGLEKGVHFNVYADETRPLLQGARLTAWELIRSGVPVTVLTDGMAPSLMAQNKIDAVIVGCDRVARNGDVANKIGTYSLAVNAFYHKVPFYVAAPCSTVDLMAATGADIPIELRDPEEVTHLMGRRIAPEGAAAYNPAFDVTPAALVTALVTDRGVIRPPFGDRLRNLIQEG